MLVLMTVQVDTEAGNAAIANGTLPKIMGEFQERCKPEAAYFGAQNGNRTAFFVFDMTDVSQMPSIAEPMFSALHAKIDLTPVMTADDLRKGLQAMSG